MMETSNVTCCHFPRGSVNRKSAYFTSLSAIIFITSLAVLMTCIPFLGIRRRAQSPHATSVSYGIESGFPRSDPDRFLDVGDENLAVADPPGLSGAPDRLDGFFDHVVAEYNLDLYLRKKINDVFGATVEFRMSLLPTKALGFGDGDALQSNLLQRLLHFIKLEGFDDRFDLFHRHHFSQPAGAAPPIEPRSRLAGSVPSGGSPEIMLISRA